MILGAVPHARIGQAFVDYMATLNIACKLQVQDEHILIVLLDPQHQQRAQQEFERFAAQPQHPRYFSASWERTDSANVQFRYQDAGQPIWHRLWDQAGPLTLFTMLICVVLFVLAWLGAAPWLFSLLSFPTDLAQQSMQLWRYVTPALLHFEPIHLVFNLVWWWYLGGRIEREQGSSRLLLVALPAAVLSGLGQGLLVNPLFIGLSGVVYGCLGYIWVLGRKLPNLAIPQSYVMFMLIWLVLGFSGLLGSSIANMAHLLGLVAGVLQGLWVARRL